MRKIFSALFLCLLAHRVHADAPATQNQILSQVDFVQKLNAQVPLGLTFRNEAGQPVQFSQYFHGKPVILSLVYFQCPMLCTESLNGLLRAIRSLSFNAGQQYNIVTVSFDPTETSVMAAAKKHTYVERYNRAGGESAWAFLVGDKLPIHQLTDSVGFHYAYDTTLGQFAHASGLVVLTPEGRVSRYLFGVEYSARDLKLALIEASAGKIGSPVDKLVLYCYPYDASRGKYNLQVFRVLRLAGAVTVLGLGISIGLFLRHEKKAVA